MSRTLRWLVVTLTLLVACGIVTVITVLLVTGGDPVDAAQQLVFRAQLAGRQSELNTPIGSDPAPIRFTVAPGDTPRAVAANLQANGLLADPDLFVTFVRANRLDTQIEAGTYFLTKAQPLTEIAYALTDSSASQIPFRILEGWRMEEVAAAIDQNPLFGFSGADFLRVVGPGATPDPAFAAAVGLPPGAPLEGFLFPETYALPASVTPEMLRDLLLEEFVLRAGTPFAASAATQGLSLFEAVTLASIIQREAVRVDEMPLISSVYRNRLEREYAPRSGPDRAVRDRPARWALVAADHTGGLFERRIPVQHLPESRSAARPDCEPGAGRNSGGAWARNLALLLLSGGL